MAIRPNLFMTEAQFAARMDYLVGKLKVGRKAAGFEEILISGEPESRKEAERRRTGIPLPPAELETLHGGSRHIRRRPPRALPNPARLRPPCPTRCPLVDTHAHVFRRDLPMSPEAITLPHHDFELDEYEAILDRHGVQYACIAAPSFLGTYNDYTLAAIADRPRFKTTVILDPATDPYILRLMDRDHAEGVRLSLRNQKTLPDFTRSRLGPLPPPPRRHRLARSTSTLTANASRRSSPPSKPPPSTSSSTISAAPTPPAAPTPRASNPSCAPSTPAAPG